MNTVENILTKGEIAHHEQFLLSSQCFQKTSVCGKGLRIAALNIFEERETNIWNYNFDVELKTFGERGDVAINITSCNVEVTHWNKFKNKTKLLSMRIPISLTLFEKVVCLNNIIIMLSVLVHSMAKCMKHNLNFMKNII